VGRDRQAAIVVPRVLSRDRQAAIVRPRSLS